MLIIQNFKIKETKAFKDKYKLLYFNNHTAYKESQKIRS